MNFDDVQTVLRATGRDALCAYDSAADPLARANTCCQGAWNMYRAHGMNFVGRREFRWPGGRPIDDPGLVEFDDPVAAYSFLFTKARELSPANSVRSMTSADVPPMMRSWLVSSGWQLDHDLFGNPFLAQRGDLAYRMIQTTAGAELRRFSHVVPKNQTGLVAPGAQPLFAVLLAWLGPPPGMRPLGWPSLTLPLDPTSHALPDSLQHITVDQVAGAFARHDGAPPLVISSPGVRPDW